MITKDRIKELIKEHDEHPNIKLGGLNFYSTYMRIVLENKNIPSYQEWDCYTQEYRDIAFREADKLIKKALGEDICYDIS
jgi:hypothetical protein